MDFYQYACGNWIASHPLPADRSRFGRFTELSERNEKVLLDILQGAAVVNAEPQSRSTRRSAISTPVAWTPPPSRSKASRRSSRSWTASAPWPAKPTSAAELVRLHRMGVPVLFSFGAQPDAKDSNRTIATLGQGGLSLPDRDYYLKTDPKSVETRAALRGAHEEDVPAGRRSRRGGGAPRPQTVLDFETILAKASLDRVSMRDPNKRYHIMTRAELRDAGRRFDWDGYFRAIGAPAFDTLNVSQPGFLQADRRTTCPQDSTEPWKAYFAYHLLHAARGACCRRPFEDERLRFLAALPDRGQGAAPAQARCVAAVDRSLGDLLGQKYIEVAFGGDAKAQINQMVDALEKAMGKDIQRCRG